MNLTRQSNEEELFLWFNPNEDSLQLGSLTDYRKIVGFSVIKEGFALICKSGENNSIIDYFKRLKELNVNILQQS